MTIDEIPVKSDKIAITDRLHQLSAQEFNALVDMVKLLRNAVMGEGGIMYSVNIKNNLSSLTLAAQAGAPAILNFTFVSQYMEDLTEGYKPTGEIGLCTVMVTNAKYPDYTVVREFETASGVEIKLDVAEYLTAGSNNIKIQIIGKNTDMQTDPITYTVQLTSLGVDAPNFQWWRAFQEDFSMPLFISGNTSKKLFVKVTGEKYSQIYETNLGNSTYTDTAYPYTVKHPGKSGVYTIEYYLSNGDGTLFTQSKYVEVICITPGETGKFVAINNIIDKAVNWSENKMFEYCLYDGGKSYSYLNFQAIMDVHTVYESVEDSINTEQRNEFVFPMEIETNSKDDFEILINLLNQEGTLLESVEIPVDNSLSFGATAGAVFYMNPRTRSNNQANYLKATNTIDGSEINVTWTGMNWGNDGWTTDKEGNRILRLMGGSKAVLDYYPFAKESALIGKTIEIDFLIDNITDYNETVTNLATNVERFVGLKVYPEKVIMFSNAQKNEELQSINICERERIRLTLTIVPKAYGNDAFNLAVIYINGVKNREFVYANNDYFAHNTPITLGSDYADVDIYGIRIYDNGLSASAVQQNYINWLVNTGQKNEVSLANDIYDSEGSQIDYNNTVDQYNCFVIDCDVPSIDNTSEDIVGTLEVFFADHPDWNFTVQNAPVGGQGTSSMKYRKWNLRWKFSDKSIMSYADGSESTTGKKLRFTKDPTKPSKSKRLTAKKNFASSMHSHKMGSVAAFNDIWQQLGLSNEANARIAVYQYPFVGFQKVLTEEGTYKYNFIGLYTMGPDKGDDLCFGYDTDDYPDLLSIEGADNAPLFALFRVPWNPNKPYMAYNPSEEAYQYNGENSWDYDAGAPDSEKDLAGVKEIYERLWMPAYNFAYSCSDRIKPFEGTAEELNANKDAYKNEPYEFWVTGGDLYYYEMAEGKFIPSDPGGVTINLYTQLVDKGYNLVSSSTPNTEAGEDTILGKSVNELNELFKKARIQKFRQEVSQYFDVTDSIFHRNWVEFNAATDNRAKNTYPYIFGNLSDGYRFRWRGDDMDTIWPITNQGQSRKGYYVETHDTYEDGGPVWNGATSVFWNLLDAAFPEEIKQEMIKFMKAMETLSGKTDGTYYDRIYAFFDKYYFQQAQEYFPMSLYNADAKWTYEDAKWAQMNGKYSNDTDPITQSLGDHYSAERRWISKRILYMMSKYSYGTFSADGDDIITVRAAGWDITYNLTPAIDMYPAVATGTSIKQGPRTKAGEVCTMHLSLGGSADQQNNIQAASYLQDIGDWYDKNVTGTMEVSGRMLRELRLGHPTEPITISISNLTIGNCVSLQTVDLRNISTLTGTIKLDSCSHLRNIYAGGTSITQLTLPVGGALQNIQYSPYNQYITLRNFPLLTKEGIDMDECALNITDFFVQECPKLDPLTMLTDIMEIQSVQGDDHALKRVRAVDFTSNFEDSSVLDKLTQLADGSYVGLNNEGVAGSDPLPVLSGTVNINGYAYEDSIQTLNKVFPNLEINTLGYAVRFQDPVMFELLCTTKFYDPLRESGKQSYYVDENQDNYITSEEILNTTSFRIYNQDSFPNSFYNTTALNVRRFNELRLFTNVGYNSNQYGVNFYRMFNTDEITLPTGLQNAALLSRCFQHNGITKVIIPEGFVNSGGYCFQNALLRFLDLPSTFTNFNTQDFRYAQDYTMVCRAENPPTLDGWFSTVPSVIYVPDNSVELYKSATQWSNHSDKIAPLSQKPLCGVYGINIVTNDRMVFTADFGESYPYEKGVVWSIDEGDEYATIDSSGTVFPKSKVWCKKVVIRGTSILDKNMTATINCIVYDTNYAGNYRKTTVDEYSDGGTHIDSSTGEIVHARSEQNQVTDYFSIRPGTTIQIKQKTHQANQMYFGFYDNDYNFISRVGLYYGTMQTTITVPSNAAYARLEIRPLLVGDRRGIAAWYTDTNEYIWRTVNYDPVNGIE